tara:strand:- start:1316 stop:2872 length:1557 start_codon:yes stop_codon:yes gene_type:complete
MVGIWASAFAQQLSDRLEDKKAENAIRQAANDQYDQDLVEVFSKQHKENASFYENTMARELAENKKFEGDTTTLVDALRVAIEETPIVDDGIPLSNQEKQGRIDEGEILKYMKVFRSKNPSIKLTREDMLPGLLKALQVNPNLFRKQPSNSEINKTPNEPDPVETKNMAKLIKDDSELKESMKDESFLNTASDFLSPIWASLTNEPGRRMTPEQVKELMIQRYGENYTKVSKYREEYIAGKGTQLRLDPDVVTNLMEGMVTESQGRTKKEARAVRAMGQAEDWKYQQDRLAGQPIALSITDVAKMTKLVAQDMTFKLTDTWGGVKHDLQGQAVFSKGSGATATLNAQGADLVNRMGQEFSEELKKLKDSLVYNQAKPQAQLELYEDIKANLPSLKVVALYTEKSRAARISGGSLNDQDNLNLYDEAFAEVYGSKPKKSSTPSKKISTATTSGSLTVNITKANQNIFQDGTAQITQVQIDALPSGSRSKYKVDDEIEVTYKSDTTGKTNGTYTITKVNP